MTDLRNRISDTMIRTFITDAIALICLIIILISPLVIGYAVQ